jgi:hypothetical protein
MGVSRRVMKFLIPVSVEALGRNDLVGRAIVPVYINPQTFKIAEKKLINSTLTKGGYSVQYWGEELATINASGTTGSSGIEGINILRLIYRNEINVFNKLLRERAENSQQDFVTAFGTVGNLRRGAAFGESIRSVLDEVTAGGATNFLDGIKSNIEEIADAARDITEANPTSVELIPTLGGFATSIILYFHGEKFQGYFTNFDYDEKADSPGLFDYNFSFTVLKRSGVRTNFMPWHRKPYDLTGSPVPASLPKEGAREDELNFRPELSFDLTQSSINNTNINGTNSITSTFKREQTTPADANNVGISRRNSVKGS